MTRLTNKADTGVFHTEVKVTPDGPCVIEVNGRVGGSTPEILALATDGTCSFLDIACRVALAEAVHFDGPVCYRRVGHSIFEPPPRMSCDCRPYSVYAAADDHEAMWATRRQIKEIAATEFASS